MLEWIITSCVLIGIVLLVRLCLKNKISLRLRYALWLIVLVRLLVPVNFFNSSMSIMNVVPESATVAELQQPEIIDAPEQTPTQPITDTSVTQVPILPVNPTPITPVTPEVGEPAQLPQVQIPTQEESPEKSSSVVLLLQIIWIAGIAITGGVFLFANTRFALRLKRTRQTEPAACPLRVYRTAVIDTPCLFGVFRPAIYLTEQAGEDEGQHHILTHEMTHYKHLDHIWGLLRCLCLALHWYNPLVWVAAICSRRDSELACDEAAIKRLGEENRAAYGRTLVRMTCEKQMAGSVFITATTMTGSKKTIKNRIKLIVKHPKTALYAVICLVLIAAIAVGCTFTGAKAPQEAETTLKEAEESVLEETTDESESNEATKDVEVEVTDSNLNRTYPYGRLIYVNNSLYSLMISTHPVSFYNDPVRIGSIESYNSNSIPSIEFSSNYFQKGTDIYQENLESDSCIYVKIRQQSTDAEDCWLRLSKTNMEKLRSTPMLTMNALKDIIERQSPEELKQFQGTVYAFGQGHGCEVQDAECYAYMYRDQFKLYRLSDLKELDLVTEKEKLDDFLKNEQSPDGKLTISGLLLQRGFDIYADCLEYSVAFTESEQSYDFSTHNHLFAADVNFLLNGFDFISTAKEFDEDLSGVSIYIHDMDNDACTITINKADQVKIHVGDSEYYYEADDIYKFASNNLLEHTKKADKYYKVDNLGAPTTYSVYGFDTSEEKNRTPYYVSLTDDNFVYVWKQSGTGTMFRNAVFYDPAHNRVSPHYLGPSDYYGNMVVSYGRSGDETLDSSSVQVCDMFTGETLFRVDEFKVPINRSMVNAVWQVYFNRDGSAILVNYYDENYDLQWETVPLPTEIRLNRKVGTSSRKIPHYSSGKLKDKPWEDEEPFFEGVPDDQAGREIAQAVLDEKFPGYTFVSCTSWTEVEGWCSSFRFENEDGTKWVEIDIDMQYGTIYGIYPLESADAVIDMIPEDIMTTPAITDAETAGRIAEAIRAGWVRQTNKYVPYLSVYNVFYDELTGYWVVALSPAVNYPAEGMDHYIVLDSKDGRIVNMWVM